MTTRLILLVFLLQGCAKVLGLCMYYCPNNSEDETLCGVDENIGAKLFHGKCKMWRNNYCQQTDYKLMDIQECLDRYPEVVYELLVSKGGEQKYLSLKQNIGIRPFQRFFTLFSFISGLVPQPPVPIAPWPSPYYSNPQNPGWPFLTQRR